MSLIPLDPDARLHNLHYHDLPAWGIDPEENIRGCLNLISSIRRVWSHYLGDDALWSDGVERQLNKDCRACSIAHGYFGSLNHEKIETPYWSSFKSPGLKAKALHQYASKILNSHTANRQIESEIEKPPLKQETTSRSPTPPAAWFALGSSSLLFSALFEGLPYDYFALLRVAVCISAAVIGSWSYRNRVEWLTWTQVIIGLLFNPFIKADLDRDDWVVIDALAAAAFMVTAGRIEWARLRALLPQIKKFTVLMSFIIVGCGLVGALVSLAVVTPEEAEAAKKLREKRHAQGIQDLLERHAPSYTHTVAPQPKKLDGKSPSERVDDILNKYQGEKKTPDVDALKRRLEQLKRQKVQEESRQK